MKTFTDYAHEKLLELFKNHSHEVGSQLMALDPSKYSSYESTDCITYALNVISYAFKQVKKEEAAKKVWKLGKHGTELASYLVEKHNWKGVYINPDINHPRDADSEHSYSSHLANSTCKYYSIPLKYKVINYQTTAKTDPYFQALNKHRKETKLNLVDLASLSKVRFGFGVSRGGQHTWLFSQGKIYEVHWDKIGSELYEASPLKTYPWLSGAIVVPADQAAMLMGISNKLKCG